VRSVDEENMNNLARVFLSSMTILACLSFLGLVPAQAAGDPPAVGGRLPDLVLPVPQDAAEKAYLGLRTGDTFRIPQIAADLVIVEIFSMYCPYCQKEAPRVNELYDLISKRANLRSRIKMIGIGAGNSVFETKVFKDQYQVPFPLLPDGDFTIHKLVGEVRTPYFIAIETRSDGWHRVLYSSVGGIEDPQKFLDFLLKEVSGQ
jgi:peroxiredoxin